MLSDRRRSWKKSYFYDLLAADGFSTYESGRGGAS
jgi:hypothetical protein